MTKYKGPNFRVAKFVKREGPIHDQIDLVI